MIIIASALALLVIYAVPLLLRGARQERAGEERDVFSPELFLGGFGMLGLPYLFLLGVSREYRSPELLSTPWVKDLDATAFAFVLVTAGGFLATLAGIRSPAAGWLARRIPRLDARRFTPARVRRAWVIGGACGLALYLSFVQSIGGLANLWAHMYLRTRLMAGRGYSANLYALLLTMTAALVVYGLRHRGGRLRTLGAVAVVLGVSVVMGSTGGRSPVLLVLLVALAMHHYAVRRRRRLLTPVTAVAGVLLMGFVLVAPLFRTGGAFDRYSAAPQLVATDALNGFAHTAPSFSSFDRVGVILNYFTLERLWWGRSYLDLLAAPIPRTLYPDKPPVDDGVYLRSIVDGRNVRPSLPARQLQPEAWPPGTFVAYMNFWIPGFLAASFLAGVAIGGAYRSMRLSNYSPSSIYLYLFAVMGGVNFSVYGIVMLLVTCAIVGAYFWVFFGRKWLGPLPRAAAAPALPAVP